MSSNGGKRYGRLTPTMMLQLAAPHTWSAAVMPVVLAVCITAGYCQPISLPLAFAMLVISVLMQASVNTLNDYMDYRKGTDTMENQLDPTDAVLVYNNVNPNSVLAYFFVLIAIAFFLGLYVVVKTSLITLWIGLFAILIIVMYSVGKTPLSYLPVGEFVSGFTMGGLICFATCYALTGDFNLVFLLLSLPLIISIGLINFTNNTCDIEKDIEAKRRTLSVLLGRKKSLVVYHGMMYAIVIAIVALVTCFFRPGLVVCICMLVAIIPGFKALKGNPLLRETRGPAMGQVVNLNITLGAFYSAAIVLGGTTFLYL